MKTLTVLLVSALAGFAQAPSTSGGARVDGKPLTVAYAYLFRAPDNWHPEETNDVVVLTPKPLDEAAIRKAVTLVDVLKLAPERIVVESHQAGPADLSICHPAFDGSCYSTTISLPDEWQHAKAENGHLTGRVRILFGRETTVFGKYQIFYEFTFDAAAAGSFAKRR